MGAISALAGPPPPAAAVVQAGPAGEDQALTELRALLMAPAVERLAEVETRINDRELLVAELTPVLTPLLRRMIRDNRDEMVEVLHPIIGDLVLRAVSAAIADLARRIDAQARHALDWRALTWRLRARLGGALPAEAVLRSALPFEVGELLLLHRASGILLCHVQRPGDTLPDRDLLAGMLTAIQALAQDMLLVDGRGTLDDLQFGEQHLVLAANDELCLVAVTTGVAPHDFRAALRERLHEVRGAHALDLRTFQGDTAAFTDAAVPLRSLLIEPKRRRRDPRALLAAALAIGLAAWLACGLAWALYLSAQAFQRWYPTVRWPWTT